MAPSGPSLLTRCHRSSGSAWQSFRSHPGSHSHHRRRATPPRQPEDLERSRRPTSTRKESFALPIAELLWNVSVCPSAAPTVKPVGVEPTEPRNFLRWACAGETVALAVEDPLSPSGARLTDRWTGKCANVEPRTSPGGGPALEWVVADRGCCRFPGPSAILGPDGRFGSREPWPLRLQSLVPHPPTLERSARLSILLARTVTRHDRRAVGCAY